MGRLECVSQQPPGADFDDTAALSSTSRLQSPRFALHDGKSACGGGRRRRRGSGADNVGPLAVRNAVERDAALTAMSSSAARPRRGRTRLERRGFAEASASEHLDVHRESRQTQNEVFLSAELTCWHMTSKK
jgi:hypothetical protein